MFWKLVSTIDSCAYQCDFSILRIQVRVLWSLSRPKWIDESGYQAAKYAKRCRSARAARMSPAGSTRCIIYDCSSATFRIKKVKITSFYSKYFEFQVDSMRKNVFVIIFYLYLHPSNVHPIYLPNCIKLNFGFKLFFWTHQFF